MQNQNVKRLSSRDKIEEITKKGEKLSSPLLIARIRENSLQTSRFAVVISSKLEKSAVKRNRLRRQIYETIRILEKEGLVPTSKSFDIVLFVRSTLLKTQKDLKETLTDILLKIYGRKKK